MSRYNVSQHECHASTFTMMVAQERHAQLAAAAALLGQVAGLPSSARLPHLTALNLPVAWHAWQLPHMVWRRSQTRRGERPA